MNDAQRRSILNKKKTYHDCMCGKQGTNVKLCILLSAALRQDENLSKLSKQDLKSVTKVLSSYLIS